MGLQKYRADIVGQKCANGSLPWYARWMAGLELALVRHCPTPWGPRTVYIRGEPDSFFSVPAACEIRVQGRRYTIQGSLYQDAEGFDFRPYTKFHHLKPTIECTKKSSTVAHLETISLQRTFMYKFNDEQPAQQKAREESLFYGWSIFTPGWYVGTSEQLKKIGVLDPIQGKS